MYDSSPQRSKKARKAKREKRERDPWGLGIYV
jgi:hypothetical protein